MRPSIRRAKALFTACALSLVGLPLSPSHAASATLAAAQQQSAPAPKANGKIAFVSGRDGERLHIYVMNPDGAGLARLTEGLSYNVEPAWSPDGARLAFVSNRDGNFEIYVMSADGSNVRRLTDDQADDNSPSWSPDGKQIVFTRGGGPCAAAPGAPCPEPDIYSMNADGSNQTKLTSQPNGGAHPVWSPDGTRIAFTSRRDGKSGIFLMNADGSNQRRLSNPQEDDFDPAWSPDGARLAFSRLRGSAYEIHTMSADGAGVARLTEPGGGNRDLGPAWSPDGRRIAFERHLVNASVSENRELFAMNADGGNLTRLTTHPEYDVEPAWQPVHLGANGKLVFTSERDGNPEIYAMNPDGSTQTNLTNNTARDFQSKWSPDGSKILFVSDRAGGTRQRLQFYVMDADGSNVTKITNFPDVTDISFDSPTWSPDGTRIVYIARSFGILTNLVVVNADGSGQPKTIESGINISSPRWSPDGTRIAYVGREAGPPVADNPDALRTYVFVVNADGTGRTRIAEAIDPNKSRSTPGLAWSPDGTRLAFASNRDGDAEIYVASASGVPASTFMDFGLTRLTDNSAEDTLPAWSPDGKLIAFTSDRDGNREIYVMKADGSNQTRLTNNSAPDYNPDWQEVAPRAQPQSQPATLQFGAARYAESENKIGGAAITVTRLGDLSHEASVDYSTRDVCEDTVGTVGGEGASAEAAAVASDTCTLASERSDYILASGTLRFAPGEASKTFTVLLVNDAFRETEEFLTLELSNARGGAGIGGLSRAHLVIANDDQTAPATNPLGEREFFVRQHYLDFLNREPDEAGLRFWAGQLPENCGADAARCVEAQVNVSGAFFLSVEFQETGFFAYRVRQAAFGALPSKPVPLTLRQFTADARRISRGVVVGADGWREQLEANKAAYLAEFVAGETFLARFAGATPAQFVDRLRHNTGAALSQAERDALVAELAANDDAQAPARVLRRVAEDEDFVRAESNRAFVLMQYFGYLRRDPDDAPDSSFAGYDFWLQKLNQFGGDFRRAEMVKAFITSGEYRHRFGP